MYETCCAPLVHCSRMASERSCGITHHMPLLNATWISGPVQPVGPAGTARLESMATSGCSVADLVIAGFAMVLRKRLGEACWCGKSDTTLRAERYCTVSEIFICRGERGRDVHAWRKRGGRADAVVDGASQCIHTYMYGCKPRNLLTCTPCQQLMSGKWKTVHCQREPTALWLIASSVVVKLVSVTTEGCSVACDVIFAAAMVQHNRYENLSRCISYRFGDLDLQSGRGQGRMGKEVMGCN